MEFPTIRLCGVDVTNCSLDEAVEWIVARAGERGVPAFVVTPNAQHMVLLQDLPRFREVYRTAALKVADGVPLLWAARLMGTPLKGRVNGTDLFERTSAAAAEGGISIFLMGGRPGAADGAAQALRARHPALKVAGTCCPAYGFESDPVEQDRVRKEIETAKPDILFVGLGPPKQEYWIQDYAEKLGVPVSVAVGGSFEMVSGIIPRAPGWMQKSGLEWFFRLVREPRRLGKRYLVTNTRFVWLVLRQRLGRG